MMRAIAITAPGGPEVLQECHMPRPVPQAGEILIKIAYAGVNRPDVLQRAGLYKPPADASPLPGLEAAGEVVALGAGVSEWKVGDFVTALLPGGGYAEYAVTPAVHALPVPEGLDLIEAAALCETAFTVWSNVVMRGGLQAAERFLVHGGSSGIGTMAIQVASALGARVFATVGNAAKAEAVAALGAVPILYRDEDFVTRLRAEGGADLILDMVGGSYIPRNIKALADEGRLVMIAFLEGSKAELNFAEVMMRRLSLTGTTLRPQSVQAKAQIARELRDRLWPLIVRGRVRPVIDSVFALSQAAEAHQRMESGAHIGKIVLKI